MKQPQKCRQCGSANTVDTVQENYRYDECGLPNVVLSTIPLVQCNDCESQSVRIPGMAQLHKVIATGLIGKQGRLTGDEVRYLREFLGWTNQRFAQRMGVDPSTSSRWSNGALQMGETSERLLRVVVASSAPVNSYSDDLLEDLDISSPAIDNFTYQFVRDECWHRPDSACQPG